MIFQEEFYELTIGISKLLKNVLPKIQAKSVGRDRILDDSKKEFEIFFLNTAYNRLKDAYQNYVFASRAERETKRTMQSKIIKTEEIIEIEDDLNESENENEIPVQLLSAALVKSSTSDWDECEVSDSDNGVEKSIDPSIGLVAKRYVKQSRPTITQSITSTTLVPANQPIQPHESSNGLKFQCNYCSISRDDISDIYKHWTYSAQHADAHKAFQFHIEMNGACFNCNKSGTFKELKQHSKNEHPGLQFSAVNISDKKECFICGFSEENMDEHFRTHHAMTMEMDSPSPIRLQANILDELKALRIQNKFKCDCCENVVYNTKDQIIEHYRGHPMNHDIKRNPYIEFVDEQLTMAICGICRKTCNETEMLDLMQNHQIQCLNCAAFDGNINDVALHYQQYHPGISMYKEKLKFGIAYLQTKFIHCNGLTLTYANVLRTEDDEIDKIQSFFTMTSKSPQITGLMSGNLKERSPVSTESAQTSKETKQNTPVFDITAASCSPPPNSTFADQSINRNPEIINTHKNHGDGNASVETKSKRMIDQEIVSNTEERGDGSPEDEIQSRKFQCKICKKRFSRKPNLNKHKTNTHAKEHYRCKTCWKNNIHISFTYKSTLTEHIRKHHPNENLKNLKKFKKYPNEENWSKPFICEYCGRGLGSKKNLNAHFKNMHPELFAVQE